MKRALVTICSIVAPIAAAFILKDDRPTYKEEPPYPYALEQKICPQEFEANNEVDKYAVLFCGSTEQRHTENMQRAYTTLVQNGFDKDHIYVLQGRGTHTAPYPVDDLASYESLQMILDHLGDKVDNKDKVIIYTTGHGYRKKDPKDDQKKRVSTIEYPGTGRVIIDNVLATEFEEMLQNIHPKEGVLLYDQCYGGGFARTTGSDNYVAISASHSLQKSNGNTFPQAFFSAWSDPTADTNNDGRLSVQEAYDFALKHDFYAKRGKQDPQIFSVIDAGEVFLR